ncbi:hypothetical protein [Actinopolymorpha sp. B9G3]|uniref:hypothetical protein n=1 Tax=Actinopolymorpha sp. B9G3 TaxID=3158970 RepID=UPI0032D98A40
MINKTFGFSDAPLPVTLVEMLGLVLAEYSGHATVAAVAAAAMPAPLSNRLRLTCRRPTTLRSPDMHTVLTASFGTRYQGTPEYLVGGPHGHGPRYISGAASR